MTAPDFWRHPAGPVTPGVLRDALAHANAEAPRESVGVVMDGAYWALENHHEAPERAFRARFPAPDAIEAVIHSHPATAPVPSAADMRGQMAMGVPWAIVQPGEPGQLGCLWGLPRPPLFGADGDLLPRAFCPGVADCYSLILDWFAARHCLALPEVPRDADWWEAGGDLYRDGFAAAGFGLVTTDPDSFAAVARPGDVYLLPLVPGLSVPTHGGVYLGNGLCLEHLPGRLAERRPVGPKLRRITHWLRHRDLA